MLLLCCSFMIYYVVVFNSSLCRLPEGTVAPVPLTANGVANKAYVDSSVSVRLLVRPPYGPDKTGNIDIYWGFVKTFSLFSDRREALAVWEIWKYSWVAEKISGWIHSLLYPWIYAWKSLSEAPCYIYPIWVCHRHCIIYMYHCLLFKSLSMLALM